MKRIEIILRPERVEGTIRALKEAGVPRLHVSHVHAIGSGVDPEHFRVSFEEVAHAGGVPRRYRRQHGVRSGHGSGLLDRPQRHGTHLEGGVKMLNVKALALTLAVICPMDGRRGALMRPPARERRLSRG